MSNTPVTPVTVGSTSDSPFEVTAAIHTSAFGAARLSVTVDGERFAFELNPHMLRLYKQSVTDEATRLLQRHAGYKPAGGWITNEQGHLTATVEEITGRCTTCVHGCGHGADDTACGHYQCLAAAGTTTANTCPGTEIAIAAKRPQPGGKPRRTTARRTTNLPKRGAWWADTGARR